MRAIGFIVLAGISSLMGATAEDHRPAIAATAQVPLSFERATNGNSRWTARGNGYLLAVGAADVEIGLRDERLRIQFVGANPQASSDGLDPLPGKVNYFIGRDPKRWLRDIPTWGRVRYNGVYPGTDVVWYGHQGNLEYDLMLQPGADASRIAMRFEGARKLAVEAGGDLRVEMAGGSLTLKLPEVYQEGSGRRQIGASYEVRAGNEVRFHVAAYDKSRALVIDPTLVYATYFGSGNLYVQGMAVDSSGNVYIGGYVNESISYISTGGSTNFSFLPVANAVQAGMMGQQNAFVSKFDPTGKTVLYSTYLGGSNFDQLNGIAVDSGGNLTGVGYTQSPDFPLVNAMQTAYAGKQSGFVFRLNAAGNGLVYSTYLGGSTASTSATGNAVAVDASLNAYVTGWVNSYVTTSPVTFGFPVTAMDNCSGTPGNPNGNPCTFVAKLSPAGAEVYGALIENPQGNAIAVDAQGAAYVVGSIVFKLSSDASSLVWSKSLTGWGTAIALGHGNVVYVGGWTSSPDLPVTANVVQGTYGGATDAFVASLSATNGQLGFVTYLGGTKFDSITSLTVGSGGLILAGTTTSRDFPVVQALQPAFPAAPISFFKSTDSGASFIPADKGLPGTQNLTILPDPSAEGTILVDTASGVYRSPDDGATWVEVEPNSIGSSVRSLSNPSVVYTSASCNLYSSGDGGQTWNQLISNCALGVGAYVLGVSPADPNTVMMFSGNTEYRSTDGGQTFSSPITTPMPLYLNKGARVVASPDGSMYAATGQSGLYKSTDAGLSWNQLGSGVLPLNLTFTLSTSNPSILYASNGATVYKSVDAGTTWNAVAPLAGVSSLAVVPADPQTLYGVGAGRHSLLFVSTDGGVTWSSSQDFLNICSLTGVSGIAVSPFNSAEVYLGAYVPQSGFVAQLSADGTTLNWSTFYGSYIGVLAMGGAAQAPSGDVWVAGTNAYGGLPLTTDARNSNPAASGTAFLARIAAATASCSYTINPTTQYLYSAGWQYAYFGDQSAFSVTAPSGCAWTATPSDTWIHLLQTSGTGSGTIPFDADTNTTANTRTGTVTVASQVYTIVQPPSSCTYQLSSPPLTSAGGTATITVTAPAGCPWDVEFESGDPARVTSPTTGTGNGTVTILIPPNASVNNNCYTVLIGGQPICISEQSACTYAFPNGAAIAIPADGGQYPVQINCNMNGCGWNAGSDQSWLTLNNANSSGSGTLNYTVAANNTGVDRAAHITVGGQQITVTQDFTSAQFADVPPSATFFDAANLMFQADVSTGCQQSSDPATRLYCPDDNVTRQELAAFIVRAVTGTTNPAIYNTTPYFQDVPITNNFFPHIQKLMELGITSGCSQNPPLFCPTATIPRWEMAMFMIRARLMLHGATLATFSTPYFADVPTNVEGNGMPFPYIQRAYEENVTHGCGSNPLVFCPDELATRGQMASFIMRALFNETTALGPSAPYLTGVSPNAVAASLGNQVTVTITGANTNFQSGDTVTVPSGMLAVSNVVVNSATSMTATLTVNGTAVAGPQALVVTTGGQNLTLPLAIRVGTY
ncbi:MAG: BACON domain-containing carbohydrate-binding protein [Bryobacteraceae bacterium]